MVVGRPHRSVEEYEGCLSLPGLLYPVVRAAAVEGGGLDARGRPVSIEASDLLARVFQHEIDHLDGILFVERLPEELRRRAMRELTEVTLGLPRLNGLGQTSGSRTEGKTFSGPGREEAL